MSDTITIEIKAPPEGWRYVGYRRVRKGEQLFEDGQWELWEYDNDTQFTYPVAVPIKPKWTPPKEWAALFSHGWLTLDAVNGLAIHNSTPIFIYGRWKSYNGLHSGLFVKPELMPPEGIPERDCCWKIGE